MSGKDRKNANRSLSLLSSASPSLSHSCVFSSFSLSFSLSLFISLFLYFSLPAKAAYRCAAGGHGWRESRVLILGKQLSVEPSLGVCPEPRGMCVCVCVCVCILWCVLNLYVCVCVCVREREKHTHYETGEGR